MALTRLLTGLTGFSVTVDRWGHLRSHDNFLVCWTRHDDELVDVVFVLHHPEPWCEKNLLSYVCPFSSSLLMQTNDRWKQSYWRNSNNRDKETQTISNGSLLFSISLAFDLTNTKTSIHKTSVSESLHQRDATTSYECSIARSLVGRRQNHGMGREWFENREVE